MWKQKNNFPGLKLEAEDFELIIRAFNDNGLPENALDWARDVKDEKEKQKIIDLIVAYLQTLAVERRAKGKELARVFDDIDIK